MLRSHRVAFSVLAALALTSCGQKPDERQLAHERFDALYAEAYAARHPETWKAAGHAQIDRYFETAERLQREPTADQAIEFALDQLRTTTPAPDDYETYGELEPVP